MRPQVDWSLGRLRGLRLPVWLLLALAGPLIRADEPPSRDAFDGLEAGAAREIQGIKFRWAPAGRFRMGSPADEPGHRADEAQVDVRLTRGFWVGQYEVTQGEWKRIVGEFPARQPAREGDDSPVVEVNFADAGEFCRKLTASGHADGSLPQRWAFRLPTEAQWEYACRAGTTTATAFGNKLGGTQANFLADQPYNGAESRPALKRATPVGRYPANAWGLCDMHGNVFEWCRDWYHQKLPGGDDPDLSLQPGEPNRDGTFSRVRRGGAWNDEGVFCRSAFRLRYEPPRRSGHIGFRVVVVRE